MTTMCEDVLKAYRDFITNMHGIAPNRVLLNPENAEVLKDELRELNRHTNLDSLPEHRWIVHGMRVVIDPWAAGVEVAYAR